MSLSGEVDLHEAQLRGEAVKAALAERHGVEHATLELECHTCAAPDDAAAGVGVRTTEHAKG